jgi:arsenate reductase (thioredoxin)
MTGPKIPATRVLFVCLGNSCRSPMAEALARHIAPDVIEASSAGLMALDYIAPPTFAVLEENGIDCRGLASKPLRIVDLSSIDLIVNLAGRPIEKHLDGRALPVEDWEVGDPFGSDLAVYRRIRDEIECRVLELAARLRARDKSAGVAG